MGILSWFIGGGWKWILILGFTSFILYVAYQVFDDYRNTKDALADAREDKARVEVVNQQNEATIEELIAQQEIERRLIAEFNQRIVEAEQELSRLEDLLSDHDLTYLAKNKPGLIERRMNDATDRAFNDLECLTGGVCSE